MKRNVSRPFFVAAALLAAVSILFFFPLLTGNILTAKGHIQNDLLNLNFPFRAFYGEWLKKGVFPFWTPLIGFGYPLFAESETGMLYPFRLLLHYFFSPVLAFNLDLVIHFFIACAAR